MKRIDRRFLWGAIALAAIILLTLVAAPRGDRRASGSTFSRAPDGYGAWYAYMKQQGVTIQQWQRPFEDLDKKTKTDRSLITLLVVNPPDNRFLASENNRREWVRRGNTIVILGASTPVTEAPFTTMQAGNVKIETARRQQLQKYEEPLLSDRFGAIVWQTTIGKGRIITVNTPFLAANAYQDTPGNFAFLAKLVQQASKTIWVDEYLHGYQARDVAAQQGKKDWLAYLTQTPLLPVAVQAIVLLLVLIWAANRRFGQTVPLTSPTIDNSTAYIQALAGVLHKAERSEFVLDAIGREEQLQIQKALGLGPPLDPTTLVSHWVEQTGRPATELQQILQPVTQKRRLSHPALLTWIKNLQSSHQHLP
jgi:Domain of unknown function (DUF4350)